MSQENSNSSFASSVIARRYGNVSKNAVRTLALEEVQERKKLEQKGFPTHEEKVSSASVLDQVSR